MSALASPSGVYNSSQTPSTLPWNTYNFCNAPHVNAAHYELPPNATFTSTGGSQLIHVSVIMRHHKRTPDNTAPSERDINPPAGWICSDEAIQFTYDLCGAAIAHDPTTPHDHPFASTIWAGSCDVGQLTPGGLVDASQHGKDLWELYHGHLGFLRAVDPNEIWVRTSTEDRTMQVAGAMLAAMDPFVAGLPWPVYTQPASIDSLVPAYPCPAATAMRQAFQAVPAWKDHLKANASLKAHLDAVFGTAGLDAWASWYDHFFDSLTARTCHGHPLPCNNAANDTCASEDDAASVFAIGDFEYKLCYIWNAAQNASTYNSLTFGVFFAELADAFAVPTFTHRLSLYVGHDSTLVRLLAGLGAIPLRWPSFGSEVVLEVWEALDGRRFIRVFHEGTILRGMEWVRLDEFIEMLRALVPARLFERCMGT